mmetsp:Transcript_32525/g.107225  ORF Transcript_32525/g.107225 Transcript_32525/m.107225 type:complete len:337 (-) Transcript_32525:136-1146(-)
MGCCIRSRRPQLRGSPIRAPINQGWWKRQRLLVIRVRWIRPAPASPLEVQQPIFPRSRGRPGGRSVIVGGKRPIEALGVREAHLDGVDLDTHADIGLGNGREARQRALALDRLPEHGPVGGKDDEKRHRDRGAHGFEHHPRRPDVFEDQHLVIVRLRCRAQRGVLRHKDWAGAHRRDDLLLIARHFPTGFVVDLVASVPLCTPDMQAFRRPRLCAHVPPSILEQLRAEALELPVGVHVQLHDLSEPLARQARAVADKADDGALFFILNHDEEPIQAAEERLEALRLFVLGLRTDLGFINCGNSFGIVWFAAVVGLVRFAAVVGGLCFAAVVGLFRF